MVGVLWVSTASFRSVRYKKFVISFRLDYLHAFDQHLKVVLSFIEIVQTTLVLVPAHVLDNVPFYERDVVCYAELVDLYIHLLVVVATHLFVFYTHVN